MVNGIVNTKYERLHVVLPTGSSDRIEVNRASTSVPEVARTTSWVPVMSTIVLGCLLLFSLYILSAEQNQLLSTRRNLKELKLQLDLQREELFEVHSNVGGIEELASQQQLKKLKGLSQETEEQLQVMIRRVSMVAKDKSLLNDRINDLAKENRALARKLGMNLATQAIKSKST